MCVSSLVSATNILFVYFSISQLNWQWLNACIFLVFAFCLSGMSLLSDKRDLYKLDIYSSGNESILSSSVRQSN